MADRIRGTGLQTIFSFFLGLMVTAFVGVGVYTFHPPDESLDARLEELGEREQAVREHRPMTELAEGERAVVDSLSEERMEIMEAQREAREAWGRTTSVILIILATVAMAISLIRADQLPVISNGLLLGGVFTMVYGVGWIVASDQSMTRFLVLTAALAITVGLGYVRFVRGGERPAAAGHGGPAGGVDADLERRVRALESRLDRAAAALDGPRGEGDG
jgi:hypothetical protein